MAREHVWIHFVTAPTDTASQNTRLVADPCSPFARCCSAKLKYAIHLHLQKNMPLPHSKRSNNGKTQAGHRVKRENIVRRLLDGLLGSVKAEFESGYMLDESIWRLAVATEGRFFSARPGRGAARRVTMEGVSLQKMTPTSESTIPTLYVGAFREVDGRVLLKGRFHMPVQLRVNMAIWFAFFLVFTASLTASALGAAEPLPWWQLAAGSSLLAAGVGTVALGRRQSMNDIPRLANVIANALSGTPESFEEPS